MLDSIGRSCQLSLINVNSVSNLTTGRNLTCLFQVYVLSAAGVCAQPGIVCEGKKLHSVKPVQS